METNTNKTQGANKDSASNIPGSKTTDVTNKHNPENGTKKHRKIIKCPTVFEWIMIALTVILAVANWRLSEDSGAQIDTTIKMANATQDMAKATHDMALTTQKSIAIAESSNMVAKRGLDVARKQMIIENTSYISMQGNAYIANNSFVFHEEFKNVGKTPAIHFMDFAFPSGKLEKLDTISDKFDNGKFTAVNPQESMIVENVWPLDSIAVTKIKNGVWPYYIHIVCQWCDLFDHKYVITESDVYSPKTNKFMPEGTNNTYKILH